jgi:hypothetical protein
MPSLSRKKLRKINPKLLPLVQKELENMLAAKIIDPTRHSSWLANLVVVRKRLVRLGFVLILEISTSYPSKITTLYQIWRNGALSMRVSVKVYILSFVDMLLIY